jgi:hypothetical protein
MLIGVLSSHGGVLGYIYRCQPLHELLCPLQPWPDKRRKLILFLSSIMPTTYEERSGFTNFTKFLIRILLSFYKVAQAPRRTLVGLYQHIPTNSVGEYRPRATWQQHTKNRLPTQWINLKGLCRGSIPC